MKNRQKKISTEDKLDVKNWLKKVNKWLTYTVLLDSLTVVYIYDNADRITESAKSGRKVFV
jgi:hypothetical protein